MQRAIDVLLGAVLMYATLIFSGISPGLMSTGSGASDPGVYPVRARASVLDDLSSSSSHKDVDISLNRDDAHRAGWGGGDVSVYLQVLDKATRHPTSNISTTHVAPTTPVCVSALHSADPHGHLPSALSDLSFLPASLPNAYAVDDRYNACPELKHC